MTTTKPSIIDISHWQTTPDFAKVQAAGVLGIILKATEGTGYMDPTFWDRREKASKQGLATSSYHFLKPGKVPEQMMNYLGKVKPVPGERVVIDYEDNGCTISELEAAIKHLKADGRNLQITVYGANGFLGAQLGGKVNPLLGECALWVASYTTAAAPTTKDLAATWPVWSLWQYTDKSTVDGFAAPVDGNVFNGSDEAALAWLSPVGSVPIPAPSPTPSVALPIVTMHLDAEVPVTLKLSLGSNVKLET